MDAERTFLPVRGFEFPAKPRAGFLMTSETQPQLRCVFRAETNPDIVRAVFSKMGSRGNEPISNPTQSESAYPFTSALSALRTAGALSQPHPASTYAEYAAARHAITSICPLRFKWLLLPLSLPLLVEFAVIRASR